MPSLIIVGYVWQILETGGLFAPHIREHPRKCPSWIGLISYIGISTKNYKKLLTILILNKSLFIGKVFLMTGKELFYCMLRIYKGVTAWKVSLFGVYLVRIQFEFGKIRARKTPNKDISHAVCIYDTVKHQIRLSNFNNTCKHTLT